MCPDCDVVMIPDDEGNFVCPECDESIESEDPELWHMCIFWSKVLFHNDCQEFMEWETLFQYLIKNTKETKRKVWFVTWKAIIENNMMTFE